MSFEVIEKSKWQTYFDVLSRTLEGKRVEIEVIGIDLGDQLQVEQLPLNGITYDPNDDSLYIYMEDVDRRVEHMIPSPSAVYVELGNDGLSQVVVMDKDGHKQIVRFRAPLELPAANA